MPVVKEVIQSSAKSIDIDIKKQIGGKENKKLRNWTIENKSDIVNNASATWLMGKDTGTEVKGGMPIAIEKSVGGTYTGKTIEINVGAKLLKYKNLNQTFYLIRNGLAKKLTAKKQLKEGKPQVMKL